MVFKEVKSGDSIYIFNRDAQSVKTAQVVNVSPSHISGGINSTPVANPFQNVNMVVDITVDIDGNKQQYECKDTSEQAYAGVLMITPNINNLLSEIRSLKATSDSIIASIDKHHTIVDNCTALLTEYDPAYKEKQETENRLDKMENILSAICNKLEITV